MKKIKLFYLITGLHPGGAELSLEKLVCNLNKNYDITVCSVIKGGAVESRLKQKGYNVISLNANGVIDFLSAILRLRKILQEIKPDILHTWMFHANIIGRLAAIKLPIKVISAIREKCLCSWMNIIDTLTQRFVDIYTANSWAIYDHITMKGINKEINVIYNGINKKFFKIKKIKHEGINLLVVANLRKQKDIPTILYAMKILKQQKLNFKLFIAGGGTNYEDERENLKDKCIQLGIENNIAFLGYVDNIEDYLAKTDIWLSATLYEGQCNALLEAMATKQSIINTDIAENRELLENNYNGFLVPIRAPVIFAEKINILINDKSLAEIFGQKAQENVADFTIEKNVQMHELLYEKLLENHNCENYDSEEDSNDKNKK